MKSFMLFLVMLMGCATVMAQPKIQVREVSRNVSLITSHQLPFRLNIPRTWIKLTPNEMQLLNYFLYTTKGSAHFTLSRLKADEINILANIRRWKGQLKVAEKTKVLKRHLQTPLGKATQVIITNTKTSEKMKVVIVRYQKQHYFFKLMGHLDTVNDWRPKFQLLIDGIEKK